MQSDRFGTMARMVIGYARVSTDGQDESLQIDALKEAGCERIYVDRASGAVRERPELTNALRDLRDGEDVLVVWRLDRIGRSLRYLVDLVGDLRSRKIGFRSLNDPIDTTSASGRLVFHVFAALAEFERDLTRERTAAGLAAARARGRVGGRPRVMTSDKVRLARRLYDEGDVTVQQIAETLGVSRRTVYRSLRAGDAVKRLRAGL